MRWLHARDTAGRVLALPNQQRGVLEQYGLTRAHADRAAWAVDHQGQLYEGAAAVNRVLIEVGRGWSVLGRAYFRLPPLRWIEDAVYRWVAANRSWLSRFYSTVPACEQPEADCVR